MNAVSRACRARVGQSSGTHRTHRVGEFVDSDGYNWGTGPADPWDASGLGYVYAWGHSYGPGAVPSGYDPNILVGEYPNEIEASFGVGADKIFTEDAPGPIGVHTDAQGTAPLSIWQELGAIPQAAIDEPGIILRKLEGTAAANKGLLGLGLAATGAVAIGGILLLLLLLRR